MPDILVPGVGLSRRTSSRSSDQPAIPQGQGRPGKKQASSEHSF